MRRALWFWALVFCLALICAGAPPRAQVSMTGAGLGAPSPPVSSACATLISQVSGIQACLDADAGVSGSTWTDQSSNAYVFGTNAVDGNSCAAPTWGATSYGGSKAGWTFVAASSQCLATTLTAVTGGWTNQSWFVAANITSNSVAFARLMNFSTAGSDGVSGSFVPFILDGSFTTMSCFIAGAFCQDYGSSSGANHRYGIVVSTAPNELQYLDNVLQKTDTLTNPTLAATGQVGIGQGGSGGPKFFDGVIRRIVITNTAASFTDRSHIDTFLSN